jgi:hypothetical protein
MEQVLSTLHVKDAECPTSVGASSSLGQKVQAVLMELCRHGLDILFLRHQKPPLLQLSKPCRWQYWNADFSAASLCDRADSVVDLEGMTPLAVGMIASSKEQDATNATLPMQTTSHGPGAARILQASSAPEHGQASMCQGQVFKETDDLAPITGCVRSKVAMERAVAMLTDFRFITVPTETVSGTDELVQNGFKSLSERGIFLSPFPCDLRPLRSYIGPSSLVSAILALVATAERVPHNINSACLAAAVRVESLLGGLVDAGLAVFWQFQEAPAESIEAVHLEPLEPNWFHQFTDPRPAVVAIAQETVGYLCSAAKYIQSSMYHTESLG